MDDVDNVDDLEVDGMNRQEDKVQVQLIQDPMNDDKGNSKIIHFIVSFTIQELIFPSFIKIIKFL